MKKLSALFGVGVAGVVVCFIMTIVVGVQEHQAKNAPAPFTIPTPAMPNP